METFIGIDMGTSACRACAIDESGRLIAEARTALPPPLRDGARSEQDAGIWWQALTSTLDRLCENLDRHSVRCLAVDATSSTLLLCDRNGKPLTAGLMYNDTRAVTEAAQLSQCAPTDSAARGASSSLAKLLHLAALHPQQDYLALHQADWLTGMLTGRFGFSDENNALKMGYDALRRCWPPWLSSLGIAPRSLPEVRIPGTRVGSLTAPLAQRWKLPAGIDVVAGTTDSTAGFIATGAQTAATAVTILGSTLVIKVLSDRPVSAPDVGVYSHRLGDRWLVGGASNAGGSVLRKLFTPCDIHRYTRLMKPRRPTGLDYYPLPAPGERFPLQDPSLQPRLEPRPASDAIFFQGILEGLSRIEQHGYRLLAELGAPYPGRVITAGGGACNAAWTQMREDMLGVPVTRAAQQEACYGAALLARGI